MSGVVDFVQRGFKTAFSYGYGYEPMRPGSFVEDGKLGGYYIDYSAKTTSLDRPLAVLTPANLAQLALGWYERFLRGEARALEEVESVCRHLLQTAEAHGDAFLWPYSMAVPKYETRPPWYSGFAQAQIASAFLRLWRTSGDPEFERAARKAISPVLDVEDSRFVTKTRAGPILEEGPSNPPSHVLNGWIFTLFGVLDASIALDEPRADALFQASTECLRVRISDYDVGWWTKYSLYPHALPDLAKPIYHRLHIDLAHVLYRLTSLNEFADAESRWKDYDTRGRCALAVGSKLPFVLLDAPRRGRAARQ